MRTRFAEWVLLSPIRGMRHRAALLILDMLNDFDFPEAPQLMPAARRAARHIRALKARMRRSRYPVIYVNDNYGDWRIDANSLFQRMTRPECPGREIATLLRPEPEDYFVIKPKHSGFFETPLHQMLQDLRIDHLVLTGIAGNICVLFTAHDAHMRGYRITVPSDAIASNRASETKTTLTQLRDVLRASTPKSSGLPRAWQGRTS